MKQPYVINTTQLKKGLANAYILYKSNQLSISKKEALPYVYVQGRGTLDIVAAFFAPKIREILKRDYNDLGLEQLEYDGVLEFKPANILDKINMLGSLYDLAMTERDKETYIDQMEEHLLAMMKHYKVNMDYVNNELMR